MDPQTETSEHLLLFRNTGWHRDLPSGEIERVMSDWLDWFDGLVADGRCKGGQSLEPGGHVVRGENREVTDGPFAETKESVAGYFILTVRDAAEAVEIAKMCPALRYGITVEVRPLRERCAASQMVLDARRELAAE